MQTKTHTTAKLYIGLDIHKRSGKIHTATDLFDGKTISCPAKPEELKKYVDKHYQDHQANIVYEAGCLGYSAHRAFESYDWRSLVVHPADVSKTGKSQYPKTDAIDARR